VGRLPKSIEPPRDLWPGIAARLRRSRRWYWVALAAAAVLALVLSQYQERYMDGDVARGHGPGTLRVGESSRPDDSSRAVIHVGDIGQVE